MRRDDGRLSECSSCRPHGLSYGQFIYVCRDLDRKGQKQQQCAECGKWVWPFQLKESTHADDDGGATDRPDFYGAREYRRDR